MYKCEREKEILDLLSENEYATVDYLARKMNISPSSIRRDLKNLEDRGLVNRSYGGVKIAEASGKHIPFSLRSHENSPQKKQMAKAAIRLVNPGDVVFLDASSSAYFVAELLPSVGGVTVVTNSVDVLSFLSHYDIKVFCTGGDLSDANKGALIGGYALNFLKGIHADVSFFSVRAVNANGEFFDCYPDEVATRKLMMQNSSRRVLLCDSSKLDTSCGYFVASLRDIDTVVSDVVIEGIENVTAGENI